MTTSEQQPDYIPPDKDPTSLRPADENGWIKTLSNTREGYQDIRSRLGYLTAIERPAFYAKVT